MQIALLSQLEEELKNILNFWAGHTLDHKNGGFVAELDRAAQPTGLDEKGVVLNARILWTFSAAYNFSKNAKYLDLAKRAYNYLVKYFWDEENGGLFWSVGLTGVVKNGRKQAYAQGFGIYGFSEYFKASGNVESLEYAIKLFDLIELNFRDQQHRGYIEALDKNWRPLKDVRLSEKDANEPKSMNTHLHIIEPYTNLYRVGPNDKLKARIRELIIIFRDKIMNSEASHFNLFFDYDWTVKSNIVSFGHDIEGAWLLNEAAHEIQDKKLEAEMKELSLKMVDATLDEGSDIDGSIFYELEDGQLDSDKHWWPQAEAMVGFLDAYQNSLNQKYFDAALQVWKFIKNNIIDKTNGEWFWKVDKLGNPDNQSSKVGFWKCPYHNSRALMEAIVRIDSIE